MFGIKNKYIEGKYSFDEMFEIYFSALPVPENSKIGWLYALLRVASLAKSLLVYKLKNLPSELTHNNLSELFRDKVVFFSPSLNNQRAVQEIKRGLDVQYSEIIGHYPCAGFSSFQVFFTGLVTLPTTISYVKSLSGHKRKVALYFFSEFFLESGIAMYFDKAMSAYRPKMVILSNDHLVDTKSIEYACEKHSVPCVYIQHASVTELFPELHFSLSILDGMDSLHKYISNNKKIYGDVLLLGASRYDKLVRCNYKFIPTIRKKCIGIGVNDVDNNEVVDIFCQKILTRYPSYTIKVRAHPALHNAPFVFTNKESIIYTDAYDESIIDFFESIDLLISDDSCIHLDAQIYGIKSYMFAFSYLGLRDSYGYVGRGLVQYLRTFEELSDILDNFEKQSLPDKEIIRFYDESYKKSYAGRTSDIIRDLVNNNLSFKVLSDKYGCIRRCMNGIHYYVIPE